MCLEFAVGRPYKLRRPVPLFSLLLHLLAPAITIRRLQRTPHSFHPSIRSLLTKRYHNAIISSYSFSRCGCSSCPRDRLCTCFIMSLTISCHVRIFSPRPPAPLPPRLYLPVSRRQSTGRMMAPLLPLPSLAWLPLVYTLVTSNNRSALYSILRSLYAKSSIDSLPVNRYGH